MKKILIYITLTVLITINSNAQNEENMKRDIVNQTFGSIEFKQKLYDQNVTNYLELPKLIAKKYGSFNYESLPLDRQIAEMVRLWASIRYKCSYCTIFHTQDARNSGIDIHKIDNIMAYKNSDLFTSKEKAALNYASAISYVDYEKLPSATEIVKQHFNEEEIETIVMCTLLMDIWARLFAIQGNTPYYTE